MVKLLPYKLCVAALWLMLMLCSEQPGLAQNNYQLQITSVDNNSSAVQALGLKASFQTKFQCDEYIIKLLPLLQSKGYLSSSIDSISAKANSTHIFLYLGENYNSANIHINNKDEIYLSNAGMRSKGPGSQLINFQQYQLLQQKLLDYFENNGYPFARLKLDSIYSKDKNFEAQLSIDKGVDYKIDSIRLFGTAKISKNFLHKYLNMERGSIYRRDKLEKINQRLLELPYLQQVQPWDITMLSAGSVVNLYLQPKRSNQVNVLAGFLPSNAQTGGKLLFTIDATLQLKNAFSGGESIGLVWQQLQPKSPRLNVEFQQPYIFNSAFGADFLFELFKKDSAYLNINAQAGLRYTLSANKTGRLIIQNQRTNVLDADTIRVKAFKQLPDIADVSSINIGADYEYVNTDYRYNPRKGNELTIFAGAGNKKIRKSNAVTQIKDPSYNYIKLYDSVKLNAYKLRIKVQAAHYFPLGKRGVLKTGLSSGWYESPNYFRNELFQLGGYRLLRGFDEQAIFASRYAVGTIEYRYLLDLNSYLFTFSDLGWSKDNSNPTIASKNYIGAGLGLAFESKGGIFNLSLAAGKRNDLPFNLRQSKIHFGYVSVF